MLRPDDRFPGCTAGRSYDPTKIPICYCENCREKRREARIARTPVRCAEPTPPATPREYKWSDWLYDLRMLYAHVLYHARVQAGYVPVDERPRKFNFGECMGGPSTVDNDGVGGWGLHVRQYEDRDDPHPYESPSFAHAK